MYTDAVKIKKSLEEVRGHSSDTSEWDHHKKSEKRKWMTWNSWADEKDSKQCQRIVQNIEY